MMRKTKLRELGMDSMERLYHERKARRDRAYAAKRRKDSPRGRRMSVERCGMALS